MAAREAFSMFSVWNLNVCLAQLSIREQSGLKPLTVDNSGSLSVCEILRIDIEMSVKQWPALAPSEGSVPPPRVYHNPRVWPRRLTRPCYRSRSSSPRLPPASWPPSWPSSPPWSSWASPPCVWSGWAAPPAAASHWLPGPLLLQWKGVSYLSRKCLLTKRLKIFTISIFWV